MSGAAIQPFMFQAHPAYRTQIGILGGLGMDVLPTLPPDTVEHERWRKEGLASRILSRFRGGKRLTHHVDGTAGYFSGTLSPRWHRLLDGFDRVHIDADDPLSLFKDGARCNLPVEMFRRWSLAICERLDRASLSFWSRAQLFCFLGNLREDESRAAIESGRIGVIPPAICPRVTHVRTGREARLRCLIIASGKFWHKGVPEAVVAIDRLVSAGRQVELTVVGADIPTEWRSFMGRNPRITLRGRMDRPEIEGLFRSHDLLVFPSHHDTYGWVLLEAKSFGLPALVTDFYNRSEIVTHECDGLVVHDPFASPWMPVGPVPYAAGHITVSLDGRVHTSRLIEPFVEELASVVRRLIEDRDLLQRLAEGALASVQPAAAFGVETRLGLLRGRIRP